MVVGKNGGGRVMGEGSFDHLPGVDAAAVDGAGEELFEGERAVAVVEEDGDEQLAVLAGKLGDEIAFDVFGRGEGVLAEEPPLELLADELEHLVDSDRPEEAVFPRPLGSLEGRGVRSGAWPGAGAGEIERELRRCARLAGTRDLLRLLPSLVEEVLRKAGEVLLQPVAGGEERLMEPAEGLPQDLAILRIGGIEGSEELPDGFGGDRAFAGQGEGKKADGRGSRGGMQQEWFRMTVAPEKVISGEQGRVTERTRQTERGRLQ
jgi:hypothetical protein